MAYSTWNHYDFIMVKVRAISIISALHKQEVIVAQICALILTVASECLCGASMGHAISSTVVSYLTI